MAVQKIFSQQIDSGGVSNGKVLTANSASNTAYWATPAASSSNTFSRITVGANTAIADGVLDTLTLVAGSGITIAANPATDTITFAATGGAGGGGGGLSLQSVQTADFTAVAGNAYLVNTTSGAITVTLPASPTAGQIVQVTDYAGTWQTNVVNINRNSQKILALAGDVILNRERGTFAFVYVDATQGWLPYSGFNEAIPSGAPPPTVEYLVVAGGGGGGGADGGGGGGAGGFRTATGYAITVGSSITVTIGAGGSSTLTNGVTGSSSVFGTITSAGGGGGAVYNSNGLSGGSGGGGGATGNGTTTTGGAGTVGQGNAGGGGAGANPIFYAGSGGGGASAVGANGGSNITSGGGAAGGAGTASSITGSSVTYAGGGGGGTERRTVTPTIGGAGGAGGGGAGGYGVSGGAVTAATAGGANLGGGGGGSGQDAQAGAAGGSGVVIIRYLNIYADAVSTTGSPTYTSVGGYKIYKWTTSGSVTF